MLANIELHLRHPSGHFSVERKKSWTKGAPKVIDDGRGGTFDVGTQRSGDPLGGTRIVRSRVDFRAGRVEHCGKLPIERRQRTKVGKSVRVGGTRRTLGERDANKSPRAASPARRRATRPLPETRTRQVPAITADSCVSRQRHVVEVRRASARGSKRRRPPHPKIDDDAIGTQVDIDKPSSRATAGVDERSIDEANPRTKRKAALENNPAIALAHLKSALAVLSGSHAIHRMRHRTAARLDQDRHGVGVRLGKPAQRHIAIGNAGKPVQTLAGRTTAGNWQVERAGVVQFAQACGELCRVHRTGSVRSHTSKTKPSRRGSSTRS